MTIFRPDSNKDQEIAGLFSLGNATKDLDDCLVDIESSDVGTPFEGCCGGGGGTLTECDITVNAGTTASTADNSLGEGIAGCGDILHLWSSNGSVAVAVSEGSAIVDLTVTPAGGAGPQGPQGAQGVAGTDGADGAQGAQGDQGIPGTAAAMGAQGPQGNTGPAGAQGAQGAMGIPGTAAAMGAQGAQGPAGADGAAGAQGAQGVAGATGAQGAQGIAGAAGAAGAQGPAGVVTLADLCAIINTGTTIPAANVAFVVGVDTGGNCGLVEVLDDCP